MGETTAIAWTDHTFNPWWGCQRVSPGCENCYAETFSKRVGHGVRLPTIWGNARTERKLFGEKHWREPLKWDAEAAASGVRRRVFCASMADVFEEREDLAAERARLYLLIRKTPHLDWLLLTKRPQNVVRLWARAIDDAKVPTPPDLFPRNVWLGTTAEDQKRADERIPGLLRIPAAVRFVSYEPALGPVNFYGTPAADDTGPFGIAWKRTAVTNRTDYGDERDVAIEPGIDWIIVGGESGPGARPFDLAWARSTVAQCKVAGVACFVKQFGAKPYVDEFIGGGWWGQRDKKGGDWSEWPEDLRVREWPKSAAEETRS